MRPGPRLRRVWIAVVLLTMAGLFTGQEGCEDLGEEEEAEVEKRGGGGGGETAEVGDRLTLKGTTYQVTGVDTASTVGDNQFTREEANGQFIIVDVSLTNRKDEPATILADNLRLIGGNGKEYSTSDDAIFAFPEEQTLLLEEIQPDNKETGKFVYDVPQNAVSGSKLQVEDLFSESTGEIELGL